MDLGRAFKFVFDDPRWLLKLLILGLFSVATSLLNFIPVLGQLVSIAGGVIVLGYSMQLIRRVMEGYDSPLPEWNDVGALLGVGVKGFVVQLGWSLPVIILGVALSVSFMSREYGRTLSVGVVGVVGAILLVLLAIALSLIAPAGLARVAATGSIGEGLNFRLIIDMVRNNLSDYIILALVAIVAALIGMAGFLIFLVGGLITVPYAILVIAHLTGQAYYRSSSTLPALMPAQRPYLEP